MDTLPLPAVTTALEGTSQIFVDPPQINGGGFKEIFVEQRRSPKPMAEDNGKTAQPDGNDAPTGQPGSQAEADDLSRETTEAVFVDTPGFRGEAYPVSDLYGADGLEIYSLTDEDLAEPILIEPAIVAEPTPTVTTEAIVAQATETPIDDAPEPTVAGLAALAAGQYAEPVIEESMPPVDIAALHTRPFVQPLTPVGDDAGESLAVTTAAAPVLNTTSQNAAARNQANVVPATGQGLPLAETADETANDTPDVVPATSSGHLNAERLAELRQIQAYAEQATARTGDGNSTDSIDIAAMTSRLDRSAAAHPIPTTQQTTAPHALNFTEKGWETAFGQNIQWMSANQIKAAQIRINPADLGPVQIDLTMHKDQLTLQIHATHQVTRDTLEAALPRLRSELAEQGFDNANIGMSDPGGQQQAGEQNAADSEASPFEEPLPAGEDNPEAAEVIPATSAMNLMSGRVSLLDTFA